jgi:hypothetical protein
MTDFRALLGALAADRVRFVVIGGAAATAHGSTRLTNDLDIVYARNRENVERLVHALAPFRPYLRGAPPGLPFVWDTTTLLRGLNFTLDTAAGPIDILGEIVAGGCFEDLEPSGVRNQSGVVAARILSAAEALMSVKSPGATLTGAGRPPTPGTA